MRCAVAKDLFQYNFQKQVAKSHGVVQASVTFCVSGVLHVLFSQHHQVLVF